jgi:hypothetical protein
MGLFGSKKKKGPILEQNRIWMEQNFSWLFYQFDDVPIKDRKVYLPLNEDFPVKFEDDPKTAEAVVRIVAEAMSINFDKLKLHTYSNGIKQFSFGTSLLFTQSDDNTEIAGSYLEDENGFFNISLDRALLTDGEKLIATIAHELAHVKLLGEGRIEENDEELTDLTTVLFGFGVFNTNCAFNFSANQHSWGYSQLGYLPQNEWGYALALFAYCRQEENPAWLKHLNKQSQIDFRDSMNWILDNEDIIWKDPTNQD